MAATTKMPPKTLPIETATKTPTERCGDGLARSVAFEFEISVEVEDTKGVDFEMELELEEGFEVSFEVEVPGNGSPSF